MIGTGQPTLSRNDIISKIDESSIIGYYLGISEIPKLINSPFRKDTKPSFYLYSPNGKDVNYIDFSNGEKGGCMALLMKLWNKDRSAVYEKINSDLLNFTSVKCDASSHEFVHSVRMCTNKKLACKVREWKQYDIDYWESYGISLDWLKYCEVYPISQKFIISDGRTMVFGADKYAYAFVERKEGNVTYKFYQPFNKGGYKWQNNHDRSVLGLWTKLPTKGNMVCICSSVKDSLCLMANTGIPCCCLQGEGYPISDTAISELRKRFTNIFICLDNDEPGLKDAEKLSAKHNLINVIIPKFNEGKDISDYYKTLNNKEQFIADFTKYFEQAYYEYYNDLPF